MPRQQHISLPVLLALSCIFVLTAIASSVHIARAEVTVSAALSAASFSVDEGGAQLTITVNGTRSADVVLPETEAFDLYQRGRSSQFNMVNGNFSSSITFTCLLRAYKQGKYTIPPITIEADGKTFTTDPIPFEVTAGSSRSTSRSGAAASPSQGKGEAGSPPKTFLTVSNLKDSAYIGELLPVEIKAYFRKGMRANLGSTPALSGDGIVMPQLNDKPQQTQEIVDGTLYSVLTWQTTLSTIKEGTHNFHIELEAVELVPQRRMSTSFFGRQSPFDDDFFDSVFGGYKQRPLKLASETTELTILPLPTEGRPDTFTGAIGDFNIETSARPLTAQTGEPVTLKITIGGTGNFDRVEAPELPESAYWKTYAPSSKFITDDHSGISGEKIFEQAIVAKSAAVSEIPSIAFSYFDPQTGNYVTRSSKPIPLTVSSATQPSQPAPKVMEPEGAVSPVTPVLRELPSTPALDLAAPHLQSSKFVMAIEPLYSTTFFRVIAVLLSLLLILAVLLRLRQAHLRARPDDVVQKMRRKELQMQLTTLGKLLQENNGQAFLAACRTTIQQLLGSLWSMEPQAITSADIAERFPQSKELQSILARAEEAAYSAVRPDRKEMSQIVDNLRAELGRLI